MGREIAVLSTGDEEGVEAGTEAVDDGSFNPKSSVTPPLSWLLGGVSTIPPPLLPPRGWPK